MIFDMAPFIILITIKFFCKTLNNNELVTFKYSIRKFKDYKIL